MKHIVKNQEPQEFIDWKNNANENWQPTYDNLQNPEKGILYHSWLEEQGYICCYCERELKENDYHIEHLRPKDRTLFPELQLDYSNLLCSCQRNNQRKTPLHCGNSKGNWFDETLLISPLDPTCEDQFIYSYDGHIYPSDEGNLAAITTIEKLKLDIDKLIDLRKNVIEPFIDENLNDVELRNFVEGYLVDKENNNGKYNEFFTTIKFLFGN